MWIITNQTLSFSKNNKAKQNHKNYSFYSDEPTSEEGLLNKIQWFFEGHILPRQNEPKEFSNLKSEKLPNALYEKYGDEFIHHLKGSFTLLQLKYDSFKIYSDRFGIRKFFYWHENQDLIISNNLIEITKRINSEPSAENMAIYALTYHFTGGRTLFKNIMHNMPGQVLKYQDGVLEISHYWKPEQLLHFLNNNYSIKEISKALMNTVQNYLNLVDDKSISLSLTGGADTRNLLAIFLKIGIHPHLYTYGNPKSADCVIATRIAESLNLDHSIYDIQMDETIFEKYARKILLLSNGLASLHRTHRFMAVENEKRVANSMFLGTMGGEFIKGVSEDDYIIPSIVYNNWTNEAINEKDLFIYLALRKVKTDILDKELLISFLNQEPYLGGDVINRKHNSLSYITAHLHDAQDVNLYNTVINNVFTPFLDIDYLEMVFSSIYSFKAKEQINNKHLKKIRNPLYAAEIVKNIYPPLLHYKYSGEHRPDEVLFNRYYAALMKRIRKIIRRHYLQNFPLREWMSKFVEKNLKKCFDYKMIVDTFDIDALQLELKQSNHKLQESYWLKYTNPIMMLFILEEFKENAK